MNELKTVFRYDFAAVDRARLDMNQDRSNPMLEAKYENHLSLTLTKIDIQYEVMLKNEPLVKAELLDNVQAASEKREMLMALVNNAEGKIKNVDDGIEARQSKLRNFVAIYGNHG